MGGVESEKKPLVGVEGAWPVLLRLMGGLGFVLPRRRSSGHYEIAYVRLIPMVGITAAISWHFLRFEKKFTNVAYDVFMDIVLYTANVANIFYAFAVALYRRQDTCRFFGSLDGTLKPARTWVSCAAFLFFSLFVAFFLGLNYIMLDWADVSLFHWICLTLIISSLPSFLDLYLATLISAVVQMYRRLADGLSRRARPRTQLGHPSIGHPGSGFFSASIPHRPIGSHRCSSLSNVGAIVVQCEEVSELVHMFNQIFSVSVLLTSGAFLGKMMNGSYYLAFTVDQPKVFYGSIIYLVTEVSRFYLLCRQADSLKEAHSMLEDALLALHQCRDTPPEDRDSLLSQLVHLKSRPAHIAIGSVGVLGSDVLVTCVNVALTYTAIVFQYRPTEGE
ncbi:hypothetical protein C7M84_008748 [Penaeus vannamei]|uniref:Gustatory receptor n=1 Tax=Penaeus vannamei TaxID=6689 RepID=A0A3R7M5V0_PENVA|nr:hypothetical protein C7M84_008748 [Penaeus vannamei]